MRVLDDDENRPLMRQTLELPEQRFQYPLLFSLRAEVRQWVPLRSRQREQVARSIRALGHAYHCVD